MQGTGGPPGGYKAGFPNTVTAVDWGGVGVIGSAIVLSPLTGFLLAMVLVLATSWLAVRATPFAVDRRFRTLQFISSALLSLAHGGNDAQKTMGIITALLYSQGLLTGSFHVPLWVVLSCQSAMALGTFCGGWRIVRTVGSRITHLTPMQGFCAEGGGAVALFGATWLGIPVSTTHTITGSIVGVGATRRVSAVRWGVARRIVVAWGVTLPASAAVAALCDWLAAWAMHCSACLRRRSRPSRISPELLAGVPFSGAIPTRPRVLTSIGAEQVQECRRVRFACIRLRSVQRPAPPDGHGHGLQEPSSGRACSPQWRGHVRRVPVHAASPMTAL